MKDPIIIYINSPIIHDPQEQCIYKLKAPGIIEGFITIQLKGKGLARLASINIETMAWVMRSGKAEQTVSECPFNISVESMPPDGYCPRLFPVLTFNKNRFGYVAKRTFDYDTRDMDDRTYFFGPQINPDNERLKKECQSLIKGIRVKVGRYPIFTEPRRPSPQFLHNLYKVFWKYNKNKLVEQSRMSISHCFLRAHFINCMLESYGIDSQKAFLNWNLEDWGPPTRPRRWSYHCAVLIIDSDNNKWVWDPWVGNNSLLIPLNKWVLNKNRPVPRSVMIANRAVICDCRRGLDTNLSFHYANQLENLVIFQGLIDSAIPLPKLSVSIGSFFKKNQEQHSDQKQLILSSSLA